MNSKSNIFFQGAADISPLLIPVVPFGIIFGVIGIELGFSPLLTYAMSFIICGGASQIVLLQLASGGASSLVALTSVSVVNSRHFLYGAVVSEYLDNLNIFWKSILSYLLYDQSFAVSYQYFKKNSNNINRHYHLLGSGITLWFIWQISTLLGIFLGAIIPDELGLSFAIPLTFISLLVQDFKKLDHVFVMMVSGLTAVIFYTIPFKAYIILAATIGLLTSVVLSNLKKKKI